MSARRMVFGTKEALVALAARVDRAMGYPRLPDAVPPGHRREDHPTLRHAPVERSADGLSYAYPVDDESAPVVDKLILEARDLGDKGEIADKLLASLDERKVTEPAIFRDDALKVARTNRDGPDPIKVEAESVSAETVADPKDV